MRWLLLFSYFVLVVVSPYSPFLLDNYDLIVHAIICVALAGWLYELWKKRGMLAQKILLIAYLGHAIWVAVSEGQIEYTQEYARGEALTFAAVCIAIWYFLEHRGFLWRRSQ